LGPRNSYLKEEGRGFNSTSGAHSSSNRSFSSAFKSSTLAWEGETFGELPNIEHTGLLRDFYP